MARSRLLDRKEIVGGQRRRFTVCFGNSFAMSYFGFIPQQSHWIPAKNMRARREMQVSIGNAACFSEDRAFIRPEPSQTNEHRYRPGVRQDPQRLVLIGRC